MVINLDDSNEGSQTRIPGFARTVLLSIKSLFSDKMEELQAGRGFSHKSR